MKLPKITVTLPQGATLKTTRRKGDTSANVLLTVNRGTEVVVVREAAPVPAPPAPVPAPPATAPQPPAPQPPAPQPGFIRIERKTLDRHGRHVWFGAWAWGDSYNRSTEEIRLSPGQRVSLEAWRGRVFGRAEMPEHTYTLLLDGVALATATARTGRPRFNFEFVVPELAPGWHGIDIGGLQPGEESINYFARVVGGVDTLVPVVQSSLELSHRHQPRDANGNLLPDIHFAHAWAWVPVGPAVARPTADHTYLPVTDPREQTADMLVAGDSYPPTMLRSLPGGGHAAMGDQAYFWDQAINLNGRGNGLFLLDGPRGVGTLCFTTHLEVGRATQTQDPASAPRKNVYACDPWRLVRVSNTGEVVTLAGKRGQPGAYELVGDWSAIPAERRGFRLLWGMCWDSRTLGVDASLPPVDGRPPHPKAPRAYVADSMNNRVCRVEFDGRSHDTPAKVSEVFTGVGVWDCVEHDGAMLVSLRDQHKVVRMTFDGEVLETVLERDPTRPGNAGLDHRHTAWLWSTTLAEAQQQTILCPEGLYVLDGLLYVGSRVMEQIVVVDLTTRQIVRRIPVDGARGNHFVKLAVSDGSYAPRGTVFYATFGVQDGGQWFGVKPDGSRWITATNAPFALDTYQMSFAVGGGRLIAGGSDYGLRRYFKGPRLDMDKYAQGEREFFAMHGRIVYGPHGVGRFDVPAASDAMRYFLTANGAGLA